MVTPLRPSARPAAAAPTAPAAVPAATEAMHEATAAGNTAAGSRSPARDTARQSDAPHEQRELIVRRLAELSSQLNTLKELVHTFVKQKKKEQKNENNPHR